MKLVGENINYGIQTKGESFNKEPMRRRKFPVWIISLSTIIKVFPREKKHGRSERTKKEIFPLLIKKYTKCRNS